MNAAVARLPSANSIPALSMNEDELIDVLQSSVYPGAALGSIKLVVNVCKASGKDPLKKPYHIVPMLVPTGKKDSSGWDIKAMRDVIMPGINDYRTDASRTGRHIGTSEPEFGPDVTETLDNVTITYPLWCRVVVERLGDNGTIGKFSAKELWKENYATKGSKSEAPNAMWKKRPYAQLAKCAEAQALRKGFPEVGNTPTADEMEGKEIEINPAQEPTRPGDTLGKDPVKKEPEPNWYPQEQFDRKFKAFKSGIEKGTNTAQDAFDFIESKGFVATTKQRASIEAVKPPIQGTAETVDSATLITYAQLLQKLNAAQDLEALDFAADLIRELPDAAQRAELGEIYNARRTQLES